jgi:hypothetical protein
VRNRATNKSGRRRKRAKAGDQSIKVERISDAIEVDRLCEIECKIKRDRRFF